MNRIVDRLYIAWRQGKNLNEVVKLPRPTKKSCQTAFKEFDKLKVFGGYMSTSRRARELTPYVCGDAGPPDDFNPISIMKRKGAMRLLHILNQHPHSVDEASLLLRINREEVSRLLNDLRRAGMVEEENNAYRVTFPVFTENDSLVLKRATRPLAKELSDNISTSTKRISLLAKEFSSAEQIESGKLLFAALGCFVLDWQGLEVLEKEGWLLRNKRQPGNRRYVLFAREKLNRSASVNLYDKMYWGSHSEAIDDFVFMSFGDHLGVRYALPDVLWTCRTLLESDDCSNVPPWLTKKVFTLIGLSSTRLLRDIGLLLLRLSSKKPISIVDLDKDSEKESSDLLHLLADMNYILEEKKMVKLNYPVFRTTDKRVIERLSDLIIPTVTSVINRNYSRLEKAIRVTSPIKNGIALNEVMNEVWHWIFAQTNKDLAERGLLYDPPKKRVAEARHIAWVSEFAFP